MSGEITFRAGERVKQGNTLTAPPETDPQELLDAIRGEGDQLEVDCEQPQAVHDHVGYIHPAMGLRTRTALARAGRTLGETTEYDDEIAAVETKLDRVREQIESLEASQRAERRKAVAETAAETTEQLEAVAAARGRVEACREHDIDADAAVEQLRSEIQQLSERQTATAAANEQLEAARSEARKRRDLREKQLTFQDRRANLQREARATLVERLREEFAEAIESVPGTGAVGDPFETSPPAAALAIARIAEMQAPVVLDCERFDSPQQASAWLDAPVIEL